MQSALKKIGNSSGVIIPKPLLAQIGVQAGDAVDIAVEDGKLIIAKVKRPVREGWEEDAKRIGAEELSEEERAWLDMPNDFDDEEWDW